MYFVICYLSVKALLHIGSKYFTKSFFHKKLGFFMCRLDCCCRYLFASDLKICCLTPEDRQGFVTHCFYLCLSTLLQNYLALQHT